MSRQIFSSVADVLTFARKNQIPTTRSKKLHEMNSRELARIRILQEWVIGIQTTIRLPSRHIPEKLFRSPTDFEFVDTESFQLDAEKLKSNSSVTIHNFYAYRQVNDANEVIRLENLSRVALSTQLEEYTGDAFTLAAFHDLDQTTTLTPSNIIVHRSTGLLFKIPDNPLASMLV